MASLYLQFVFVIFQTIRIAIFSKKKLSKFIYLYEFLHLHLFLHQTVAVRSEKLSDVCNQRLLVVPQPQHTSQGQLQLQKMFATKVCFAITVLFYWYD